VIPDSELQGCGELEQVAFHALFITELRDKPRIQIEQALSGYGMFVRCCPSTDQ